MCRAKGRAIPPDGNSRPEDVGLEQKPGPCGIENSLRGDGNFVNFKIFGHDQEYVEIPGGWFSGDETAPNENASQLSVVGGQFQKRPKTGRQPYAARRRTAEPGLELSPIRHMHAGRQFSLIV